MWRINSVEEITTTTTESFSDADDDEDNDYPELSLNDFQTPIKVAFPEAGIDLIDANVGDYQLYGDLSHKSALKCSDSQNWEENWLFRKRKKMGNKSDVMLGYMAMILAELPVCMLIPNPNDKIRALVGEREVDELSELSEHNSVGSLEFSDDESEYEYRSDDQNVANRKTLGKHINNEYIETKILDTIRKTETQRHEIFNSRNIEQIKSNESKVFKTKVVGNKNKPISLTTKVPNFLPKELRTNDMSAKSDPHLVLKPGDACVQSGILVQFCCRAKGTKPLLFSWFKSDTILKSDSNFRIFQSGEENVLEIKNTSVDYSAQYSCVVYNRFGYQWCDFNLEVKDSSFSTNKMPINKRNVEHESRLKSEALKVSKITTNPKPKHENQKTHPLVIQRTWAERVAELKNINSDSRAQTNCTQIESMRENSDQQSDKENEANISVPTLMSCTIAEREHKKWENPDIDWKDNPYSTENLNSRIQKRALTLSLGEESSSQITEENNDYEEEEVDTSFLSSNSKDLSRYKKDYYVRQTLNKEETLRSYDENEYSNPKYFDSNSSKRKLSEEMSQISEISIDKNSNETESELILSDSDTLLPSVKDLVNRFTSSDERNDRIPKLIDIKRKNSFSNTKINHFSKNLIQTIQPNFKVHSLTARSLTKEFREMSQINIPRTQRNRMGINGQNKPINPIESESSSPSTTCSPTNEGYASDESNTSSTGITSSNDNSTDDPQKKASNGRKFSRSILRRASYWEKRCEQGLISDSSVNEDFPPMETIAKQ